jgi:hypothetical protein
VALKDPGHDGELTAEITTCILEGEKLGGPITPVPPYRGRYRLDVGISGRKFEIKPSTEFLGKHQGVDRALALVQEKKVEFRSPDIGLILDTSKMDSKKIEQFQEELDARGIGPETIFLVDSTNSEFISSHPFDGCRVKKLSIY